MGKCYLIKSPHSLCETIPFYLGFKIWFPGIKWKYTNLNLYTLQQTHDLKSKTEKVITSILFQNLFESLLISLNNASLPGLYVLIDEFERSLVRIRLTLMSLYGKVQVLTVFNFYNAPVMVYNPLTSYFDYSHLTMSTTLDMVMGY